MRSDVLSKGVCAGIADVASCHAEDNGRVVGICKVARVNRGKATMSVQAELICQVAHTQERRMEQNTGGLK